MPELTRAVVKADPRPGAMPGERPVLRIKPDAVLVQVKATLICGTDVHICPPKSSGNVVLFPHGVH